MPLTASLAALLLFSAGQTPEQALHQAVVKYCEEQNVPGCAVAVGRSGRIAYEVQYGHVDLPRQHPVRRDTLFRLASVSKPVTATVLLRLAAQGRLRLEADVREYVPEYPDKGHRITVRDLLSHQSGVRHYIPGRRDGGRYYPSPLDSLEVFKDDPLLFQPGERYSYSTHAYTLLARVAEVAGGASFHSLLRRMANEAGARTLDLEILGERKPNRSGVFELTRGEITAPTPEDNSWKFGGGGMESSAGDLCRFGMALLEGRLLHPATVERMWTSQRLRSGGSTGYGLGWGVSTWQGQRMISHNGSQQGARSAFRILPEKGLVVVVLTNRSGHNVDLLANQILGFF